MAIHTDLHRQLDKDLAACFNPDKSKPTVDATASDNDQTSCRKGQPVKDFRLLRSVDLQLADAFKNAEVESKTAKDIQSLENARGSLLTEAQSVLISEPSIDSGELVSAEPIQAIDKESFAIVGTSVSAASGATPQGKLFIELYGDIPLNKAHSIWGWGFARLGSIGETTSSLSLGQLANTASTALSSQNQQIVQSLEFGAGGEFRLVPLRGYHPTKTSVSLVFGGGALTPATATQISQQQQYFQVTSDVQTFYTSGRYGGNLAKFQKLCPSSINSTDTAAAGTVCYVDFYPQDRPLFFSHYEAGVRVKIPAQFAQGFPMTLDATMGQNSYVTGGLLRGAVARVGAVAPFPVVKGLYLFGSMDLHALGSFDAANPLLLGASSTANPAAGPSNSVHVITPEPNRDRYILGVGFDLSSLIAAHSKSK